jgi:hypothetical protein
MKLEACLADALGRQPGPAVSKGTIAMRPSLLDSRRPVLTQSSTSYEVEDWEAARGYFFFRRYLALLFVFL